VQEICENLAIAKLSKYLVQDCVFKAHLLASLAFPYASLLTFELTLASPSSECLALRKS